jgi:hypothetical protein
VRDALKSDTAFLIQKNDGRFTLRHWGNTYNNFSIENWRVTKFPTKDYSTAQKNFFSSCIIKYNYDFAAKEYPNALLFDANESGVEDRYNKLVRKTFETCMTNETDADTLANKLSNRFSTLHETIKIGVGYDTSEINLLDTVEIAISINGRVFSNTTKWIVIELDPAQDVLTLEPKVE